MINEIKQQLIAYFKPSSCEVVDFSHEHHGHGDHVKKGSHLRIFLRSSAFEGKSRVQQHQLVHQHLKPFFEKGLHAVELNTEA